MRRRWALFRSTRPVVGIVIWAVFALAAFVALDWLWGEDLCAAGGQWCDGGAAGPGADIRELVLAGLVTVGCVGVLGLVVAGWRRRRAAVRLRIDTQLLDAVQQLGSARVDDRIAGVRALVAIADAHRGGHRQRVADILSGYLRTARGRWVEDAPAGHGEHGHGSAPARRYVSDDRAVEALILEVFSTRLRRRAGGWAGLEVKLAEAVLGGGGGGLGGIALDLSSCSDRVDAPVRLNAACDQAVFLGGVRFCGARFRPWARFRDTVFDGVADFARTSFSGHAADFGRSRMRRGTNFDGAAFGVHAIFYRAVFEKDSSFAGTRFDGFVMFDAARFAGPSSFTAAVFATEASFDAARFESGVSFAGAAFKRRASFANARFLGDADFTGVTFRRGAMFQGATFIKGARVVFPTSCPLYAPTGLPYGARWVEADGETVTDLQGTRLYSPS